MRAIILSIFLFCFSHRIRVYTQELINDANSSLNQLDGGHIRHLKLQRDRLLDDFGGAIGGFQAVQRKFVEQEKQFIRDIKAQHHQQQQQNQHHGNNMPDLFDREQMSEDNDITFGRTQNIQIDQEEMDLRALEEQERSIKELEENIANVNEIYSKLGALVYEQGAIIDSIEASVERTENFVEEGASQLRQASVYRVSLHACRLLKSFTL